MKICPKCGNTHEKPGTFCSRRCANSHTQSPETNRKRSESNKKSFKKKSNDEYSVASLAGWETRGGKKFVGEYSIVEFKYCTHCGMYFTAPYGRSWCSEKCFIEIKRKNWKGNKQRYKGISYDSSWEVKLADWMKDNNIEFIDKPDAVKWVDRTGKEHRYFPDFYIPKFDLYLDPKNKHVISLQHEKLSIVSKKYNLLYGELEMIKEQLLARIEI